MNDERIEKRLSIVKRNLLFLWLLLPPLSVGLKFLIGMDFSSFTVFLPEFVLFSGSVFSLFASLYINLTADVVDERVILKKNMLYQRSFLVLIISTGIAYLVQVVLSAETVRLSELPTNFFVNSAITLSFLVYYISSRKQKIYLNFKFIENDRLSYFKQVGKTIVKMGTVALAFGVLGILTKYLFQDSQSILMIEIVCFVSFLIIAIEYFFLSILEKNHFDEALSHEHGKTILLSKNVRLLLIIEIILSFFIYVLSSLVTYLTYNHIDLPALWAQSLSAVSVLASFFNLSLLFLSFFATVLAFFSLKRSLPADIRKLKLIFVLYSIGITTSLFQQMFFLLLHFLPILDSPNGPAIIMSVSKVMTWFFMLDLIIFFLCFLLFQKHQFGFAWLIFFKVVLSVINYLILPVLVERTPFGFLYFMVVGGIFLAQSILSILLLVRMTKIYIIPEQITEIEITVENNVVE
jgi:hypothetical protein